MDYNCNYLCKAFQKNGDQCKRWSNKRFCWEHGNPEFTIRDNYCLIISNIASESCYVRLDERNIVSESLYVNIDEKVAPYIANLTYIFYSRLEVAKDEGELLKIIKVIFPSDLQRYLKTQISRELRYKKKFSTTVRTIPIIYINEQIAKLLSRFAESKEFKLITIEDVDKVISEDEELNSLFQIKKN